MGTTDRTPRGRLRGVDAARAIAILGMFAVHVGPTDDDSLVGRLYALPHGRASLLFALVAGVGVSLLAASPHRARSTTRWTLLWRAALLLPAGLALQQLDHGVNVILQSYALLFVVAMIAVGLPDRWLLGSAALTASVGPLLVLAGQRRSPELFARDPLRWTDPVGELGLGLVVSGPYPVVTWAAPLLVGLWLGRRDLAAPRMRWWSILGGTLVAVLCLAVSEVAQRADPTLVDDASPGWLLLATPHSQMPLWLLGGTASAVAVLGLAMTLAPRFPRLLHPVAATGTLAFTVYVGHLLVLHAAPQLRADTVDRALLVLAAATVAALALSTLWHRLVGTGPLERLLRLPSLRRDP